MWTDCWPLLGRISPRWVGGLADLQLRLCAVCDLPPAELASRLVDMLVEQDEDSVLDIPDAYADLLGDEGIEEFRSLTV